MGRPRIFNKPFQDEVTNDSPNSKFHKNDLFEVEQDSTKETHKAAKILAAKGFSKRAAALTKKLNIKIKEDLKLSDIEYLVLIPFFMKSQSIISATGIQRFASANDRVLVQLYRVLFSLFRKGYLSIYPSEGDVNFSASIQLMDYLRSGEWKPSEKRLSLKQTIKTIDTLANCYNNINGISILAEVEILNILSENQDYDFCKEMMRIYAMSIQEAHWYEFVFYMIGHIILGNSEGTVDKDSDLIEIFCKFDEDREHIINDIFLQDSHPLFKLKVFDRAIDESGKADKNKIELHADFKRKFLQNVIRERRHEDVINYEKISKKELYFNEAVQKQLDDLSQMLEKEKFDEIKKRLKDSGTRTGFACLFSGIPGSGKTEEVLQIAKKTGRNVIKVDMSSLRSKWWGEDEKNVKNIFTNYKSVLQDSKIEPILLLNEADAIIGKRLDVTGNNGAIITSINAVQNIILEELETFEGIMIATTNLTQNMDNAFERRFLFRVEFDKPNVENKAKIWENMLSLEKEDAMILAKEFDLTGAQIENIFRKRTADSILYGNKYDLEKLKELCKAELKGKEGKIIGFGK